MFCQATSGSKGEQDTFCICVIEHYDAPLAGFWWPRYVGKLADLVFRLIMLLVPDGALQARELH